MVKDHILIYIRVIVSGLDYVQKRNSPSVKSVKNAQMRLHVQAIAKVLGQAVRRKRAIGLIC